MTEVQPVVLVDDNHDDLFILKRLLTRAGLRNAFVSFDHSDEAARFLAAAMRTPETNLIPAAVFSDKRMPGMDGFDLLKWVRRQPPLAKMPFFLLTSAPEDDDHTRAMKLGATRFFEKFPSEKVFAELFGLEHPKR